jgi:hypothetical protein
LEVMHIPILMLFLSFIFPAINLRLVSIAILGL